MAEELSSLLDRIQKDGVEKAEARAAAILDEARARAAALVKEAGEGAAACREQAERDAAAFEDRGRRSLEQAARDVVLSVADAVNATLAAIVKTKVAETLTPQALKDLLVVVVNAYCGAGDGAPGIDVLLPPDRVKAVRDLFTGELAARLGAGLELKGDGRVLAGFKVAVRNETVEHDFTADAIAESLCTLLRPHLAEIVRKAAGKTKP